MADFASISFLTKPFSDAMSEADRVTDKSTLYALRATGRLVVRKARARAPVYTEGLDPRVVPGLLKKSISNSRTIHHLGTGSYSMKVGAFGSTKKGTAVVRTGPSRKAGGTKGQVRGVPLYRAKMEDEYGYMAAGLAGAEDLMRATYENALAKAYARFK